MIAAYLQERYPELTLDLQAMQAFKQSPDWTFVEKPWGFIRYQMKGDAVIISDIYVDTNHRDHSHAWQLHDEVMSDARKCGKRVAIGFSEVAGSKHKLGLQAMKTAGFKPAFKTNSRFVFIKGI